MPAAERPVEPDGLVLVAGAAGKLAERGLARLLATPAPAALVGLIEHTPERALNALVGPVRATLSRWRGRGHSATLAATVVAALTTTPVAALAPNLTAVAPVSPVPVMVTLVPAARGPAVGVMEVMAGTAT